MRDFLRAAHGLELVVVDESFIDFAGDPVPSLLQDAEEFSNLLVVRSMSKHCGVPGLRIGYAYTGNLYLLNRLRKVLPTWNINAVAEFFLSLLPSTNTEYHDARRKVIEDVSRLRRELAELPGLKVYPTGANFVLARLPDGMKAVDFQMRLLRERRLYVRDCSNKIGMDDSHVRIASQGQRMDGLLVEALREWFA